MLVKRGEQLDAGRAVVQLMKHQPEAIGVPQPVPPVKNEGATKPICQALGGRRVLVAHVQQRVLPEIVIPGEATQTNEHQLHPVDSQRPPVPGAGRRQFPAGKFAFQYQKYCRAHHYQQALRGNKLLPFHTVSFT